IPAPVFATIGDSTFFHAGLPGLANMLQHNVNMTLVILDNGWTGMTGMQINPGTEQQYQKHEWVQLDIVETVRGMGAKNLWVVDAYDVPAVAKATEEALKTEGPKVIISRRECATQAGRHRGKYNDVTVVEDKCIGCKKCIVKSGCAALLYDAAAKKVSIDAKLCNGCTVCTNVCPTDAIDIKDLGGDK
ncbi:MAG: 4Fe-4S binding protein, partial [Eubacterium sp.]|nr:4Fe-4S binding protein [Candidatus Colimonas fimequi]